MVKTKPCASRKRLNQNPASVDRLSGLPDAVICQILSFLPTKLSVATSILAKRWRFLWTHVPNLYFDRENHNIINRVIMLHKVQSLTIFRLRYIDNCEDYEFETWITIAIARNVQNLDIRLDHQLMLPRCLFTCKTLVNLTLYNCVGIPSSGAVYLPSLKKLDFYFVRYQVDEALPHLLSCCPVLEELFIGGIVDNDLLEPDADFADPSECIRRFDNLTKLEFAVDWRFLKNSWKELHTVYISRGKLEPDGDFADPSECIRRFDNLTKLELAVDWRFRTKFPDNLEVLIVFLDQQFISSIQSYGFCYHQVVGSVKYNWMTPKQVPTCLLSHLRTVRIDQFGSTKHEFKLVRYLLKNAKVLERM
ncbi:hypothetical protein DH2020_031956 [Rehmannia glutinosa]|uniref:F-box protein n=1 Tax=Rehmannia glutinosa TaxID=99300 RepID=A0ABR0VGN7_REHGL